MASLSSTLRGSRLASHEFKYTSRVRYVVYDPKDPRKGQILADPALGQIVLSQGSTITKALAAASTSGPLASGAVVWDRQLSKVAYRVP
jgi:hypothetical protein